MKKRGIRKKKESKRRQKEKIRKRDNAEKIESKKIKQMPAGAVSRKKVLKSYAKLQKLFKKNYEIHSKNKDKENFKKLNDYKSKITSKIEEFKKDSSKIGELAEEIKGGRKFLKELHKLKPKPDKAQKIQKPKTSIAHATLKSSKITKEVNKAHTKQKVGKGEVLEVYNTEVDGAEVKIEIKKEKSGIFYNLYIPEISVATTSLLNDIRNELITITSISMKELIDPKSLSAIKQKFMHDATRLIKTKLPHIEDETRRFLVGNLMQEMLGLGKIEFLISDPNLEEIVIVSSKEPIRVFSKKYGWLTTNIEIKTEEDIINYSNIIARRVGRQITVLNPLLDAHLVTGDRINAVLYPINTKGNTITIRKFARDPYTIIDLISNRTCNSDTAALLWLAIEYEMNVLISGGTASGKTVFLNACMPFIPPNHRILSIEDTRELMLPEFLYWTPLVTRTPNPEGKGEVSMLDLLINSLRMRPDRIILGEMRKHEEAMVLFEAMHTGHSVYATVHAESAAETVSRLVNPPLNIPPNLLKAINLNVIMFRDRRKGIRRISQIAEIESSQDEAKANILYRWSPEKDKIIRHSESSRFFEDISRHTGMSEKEISDNLEEKKKILSWLLKSKTRDLKSFGKVMNLYYKNKENLLKAMNKNDIKLVIGSEEIIASVEGKAQINIEEKKPHEKKKAEKPKKEKKSSENEKTKSHPKNKK